MTNSLPDAPAPNTNIAIRLSTHGFWEDTSTQPIVPGDTPPKEMVFIKSSQKEGSNSGRTRIF